MYVEGCWHGREPEREKWTKVQKEMIGVSSMKPDLPKMQ
jgi:hypothetical protein